MSHVKNFKSFTKQQEKLGEPQKVEEQGETPKAQPNVTIPTNVAGDPAVMAAQKVINDTDAQIANLNSQIAALQKQRATASANLQTAVVQANQKASAATANA